MNKFERHAEDASSDDLRLLYAKILAGEIRNTGSISPSTLHFVSMLDGDTSRLVERVLPHTTDKGIAYTDLVKSPLSIPEQVALEQSGFWTVGKTQTLTFKENSFDALLLREKYGVFTKASSKKQITLQIGILSKEGRDLAQIIDKNFDVESFAEILFKFGIEECIAGNINTNDSGTMFLGSVA